MLANSFRRDRTQVVGMVTILVALGIVVVVVAGWLAQESGTEPGAGAGGVAATGHAAATVLVGSILLAGCVLAPLAFGSDSSLDVRSFASFGIAPRRLARLVLLSGAIGGPTVLLAVLAGAPVLAWSSSPPAAAIALLAVPLTIATGVLAIRISTSVSSALLQSSRSRGVAGLLALALLAATGPALAEASTFGWASRQAEGVRRTADSLGWTPLGAAWAAPIDAAAGNWTAAAAKLTVALITTVALWAAWEGVVARLLLSTGGPSRVGHGRLGWFSTLPASATAVIAARSITYWVRDPRYRVQLAVVPVVPIAITFALLVGGANRFDIALLPVPIMCLFLGWLLHNDIAWDGTAVWMQLVSIASGAADRFGRTVPILGLGILVIGVGSPLSALVYGDPSAAWSVAGVSSCLLLSGLGASSIVSARFPYPAVRPGDGPFRQPQTESGVATQAVAWAVPLVLSVPAVLLGLAGLEQHGVLPILAFVVGIGIGSLAFGAGIRLGGAIFDRRAPELLEFTARH